MPEGGRIKIGIDYDGVTLEEAKSWDVLRKSLKTGLSCYEQAIDGINFLKDSPDVDVLGIYTKRPLFRKKQTISEIVRLGIPVESVTHTTNSSKAKVEALLLHSIGLDRKEASANEITDSADITQIVLIDNSVSKIVTAAKKLAEEKPYLRPLMEKFTLAAFNPKQPEALKGLIIPGVIHVVCMKSWSDAPCMLDEVRNRS